MNTPPKPPGGAGYLPATAIGTFAQPKPSVVMSPVTPPKSPAAPPPSSSPMPPAPTEIVTESGGTNTVHGKGNVSLARYVGQKTRTMAIYSHANAVKGAGGDASDQRAHQTMMRISWGTLKGSTQRVMEVPCGKHVTLTASTIDVQGFMRRYDGADTVGTFLSETQCFIAADCDMAAPATFWQMPPYLGTGAEPRLMQSYQGLMSTLPVTVHELHGRNAGPNPETILLYDCQVDTDDPSFSAHNDPILDSITVPAGEEFFIDYGDEGRQFFNGLLWVASSSQTTVAIDTTALVFGTARMGVQ